MKAFFVRKLLNSEQIEWNGGVKNCTNEEYPGDRAGHGGRSRPSRNDNPRGSRQGGAGTREGSQKTTQRKIRSINNSCIFYSVFHRC